MTQAYRLKDVRVSTYDGHVISMEIDGLFSGGRRSVENRILDAMRGMMRNDIPVRADFRMVPV